MNLKKIIAARRPDRLQDSLDRASDLFAQFPKADSHEQALIYLKARAVEMLFDNDYWHEGDRRHKLDAKAKKMTDGAHDVLENASKYRILKAPLAPIEPLHGHVNLKHVGAVTLPAAANLSFNMDFLCADTVVAVSDGVSIPESPNIAKALVSGINARIGRSGEFETLKSKDPSVLSNQSRIALFIQRKIREAALKIDVKNESATLNLNLVFKSPDRKNYLFSYNIGDSQSVIIRSNGGLVPLNPMIRNNRDVIFTSEEVAKHLKANTRPRDMRNPGACVEITQKGLVRIPPINMTVAVLEDGDRILTATDGIFDNWSMSGLGKFIHRRRHLSPGQVALQTIGITRLAAVKDEDMTLVLWDPAQFVAGHIRELDSGCSCVAF